MASRSVKVLLLTFGNGINILMNFIMMPYLARSLSYEEYGTYGQVLMITALLQVIFTFSLNQMVNLVFADSTYKSKESFATIFYLTLFTSLVGLLVMTAGSGIVSGWFNNQMLKGLLMDASVFLCGQIVYSVLFSILIFHDKIRQASFLLIISNIIKLTFIFISIHFYHSLDKVILTLNIVSVFQVLMVLIFMPRAIISFIAFNKKIARWIFKNAYPLTLSGITERGVFYIDGMIISSLLTTSDYAVYRAGAFEVPFVSSIYGSVSTILLPEVARLYEKGDFKKIIALKQKGIISNACLIYPILIFLLFFGKPLLEFYLTDKYAGSLAVFALFNLALLVRVTDYQDILVVSANTKYIFLYSILMFILNLALNFILISYFGIIGGAIAFISFLFLYAGLLAFKSANIIGTSIGEIFNFKKLGVIILVAIICIQPFYWAGYLLHFNIIFVVGAGLVFLLSVYFFLWKMKLLDNQLLNQLALKVRLKKKKDNAGS